MTLHAYRRFRFSAETEDLIDTMNVIVADYIEQGFKLTVRQLYYQLVARGVIPNNEKSYKRVTGIVNDARVGGLMHWEAIEDRTRAFVRRQRWESGKQILQAVAETFHMDLWDNQPNRPFVIIEKEALVGVLEPTCRAADVPMLAARGYPSASVLREFVVDDILPTGDSQNIVIIHLGDHDPSGLDMTRDLRDRIEMFCEGTPVELVRIALNMDQINARKPPPNPAKTTDSRFEEYRKQYGDESWELDALPPAFLAELVDIEIDKYRDREAWATRREEIEDVRTKLAAVAKRFKA
jgi:hypothetical protein